MLAFQKFIADDLGHTPTNSRLGQNTWRENTDWEKPVWGCVQEGDPNGYRLARTGRLPVHRNIVNFVPLLASLVTCVA